MSQSFQFPPRRRGHCALAAAVVVCLGLLWRSRILGLPAFPAKYGGDALWAMMVYFGFGSLARRAAPTRLAVAALGFCWLVEFSQLWHPGWLEAIRATRLGHLALGSTFNPPDLLAYLGGIVVAAVIDRLIHRPACAASQP